MDKKYPPPIAFFFATGHINKDKENMTRLLVERGAALICSFEAGARTGIMGMGWESAQVQKLLAETAKQPELSLGNRHTGSLESQQCRFSLKNYGS